MDDFYKTIEKPAEGFFRDKNSRFYSFGYPVETILQIDEIITALKKRYHDARHYCYAYRLGTSKNIMRINDDGEPAGTAGKPIYNQLLHFDLTNILAIVVRYFGGTLLGTGGLINAYKSATYDMISKSEIVTRFLNNVYQVSFPYDHLNPIIKILKEEKITHKNISYDNLCSIVISVRVSKSDSLLQRLRLIKGTEVISLEMNN